MKHDVEGGGQGWRGLIMENYGIIREHFISENSRS